MTLRTVGLTKRYGTHTALSEVDMVVEAGSVYGLVGPNGAGKTTLLAMLAGLRRPTAGADRTGRAAGPDGRAAGHPQFDPWLTGREVVALAANLAGVKSPDRPDSVLRDAGRPAHRRLLPRHAANVWVWPRRSSAIPNCSCSTSRPRVSKAQAIMVAGAIGNRMVEVGLRLHPDKTKIVYCQDGNRRERHEHTAFTFRGYTFRARGARTRTGKVFTSFAPAISKEALKRISVTIRRWRLDRKTGPTLADLARWINPTVRGWMQYYGRFNRSALYRVLQRINTYLMRFLRNKFKRVRSFKKAKAGWQRIISQHPKTFAHWAWTMTF